MPKATAREDSTKVMLKTCPDGYVVIRSMNYGEELKYESLRLAGSVARDSLDDGKNSKSKTDAEDAILAGFRMEMRQDAGMAYAFAVCVIEHNLEDHLGRELDFRNTRDVFRLDPTIADEIAKAITAFNASSADATLGGDDLGK